MPKGERGIVLHDNIPVEILDGDFKKIGEGISISKVARMCFLKPTQIWNYLFLGANRRTHPNRVKGILSKVTEKRYHFKLKQ